MLIHDHSSSYLLLLLGILIYSFDSTLILLDYNLSEWTNVFWRQLFQVCVIILIFIGDSLYKGKNFIIDIYHKFVKIGYIGLVAGLFDAIYGACYVMAVLNTTTANVFLILAIAPLMVAILSYYFLNETVHLRTYVTLAISLVCVVLIFYYDVTSESTDNDDVGSQQEGTRWYGNLLAIASATSFSIYMVIIRFVSKAHSNKDEEEIDFIPVLIVSSLFQCLVSLCVGVDFSSVDRENYAYLFLQGGIELPLGSAILIWASKYIRATDISLMMLLESVLEPFWVWIFGLSTPPVTTLIIGSVMFASLLVHSYLDAVSTGEEKKYIPVLDTDMDEETTSTSVDTPNKRYRD